jgi:hypothetical protein
MTEVNDEMMVAEKAGMLVGTGEDGAVEVIGWVMQGDEYDLREGETLVTHHKTAEKLGVGDAFKEMKAENAPVKAKKEVVEGVERTPRERFELTPEMNFEVLREDFVAATTQDARGETYRLLFELKNVGKFFEATKGYNFIGERDGKEKFCTARECVVYAFKRGAITRPA